MAGRPSRTAAAIAAARAVGLAGLHDPLAVRFLPAAQRRVIAGLRRSVETSPASETVVNTLTAGLAGHAALRMDAVDRAVKVGLTARCRQMVVVGAGFDTRAWRIKELSDCHVVEVDLPETQRVKRRALGDMAAFARVAFASVDLATHGLADALDGTGHDAGEATIWVWEAVAPYLPRQAVLDTIASIARLSAPGSHLAMTVAHPDLIGRGSVASLLSPAAKGLFAGIGEPLRSTFDDDDITAALEDEAFMDIRVTGSEQWAASAGRAPLPDPFAAERLVTAGR